MEFFGLTFTKLLPIMLLAVLLLGPSKMPEYVLKLRDGIRTARNYARNAKDRMKEEMGPEFEGIDWRQMDPRQYDPRRIVRDALRDDPPASAPKPTSQGATPPIPRPLSVASRADAPAPFDSEAT